MSDLKDNIKDDRMPRSHLNLRLLLGETADYKRFNAKKKQKVPPRQKKGLVPPPPPAGHLERTHVQTTAKPSKVMKDLKEILEDLNVDYEPTDKPFQYACVFYPGAERVGFMCTLFEKTPGNVVLEVQRRGGNVMKFYRKYQDLIDAAAEKKLVVARDPTKFHVRKAVTLDDEWNRTEKEWGEALKPLIIRAGSWCRRLVQSGGVAVRDIQRCQGRVMARQERPRGGREEARGV